MTNCHKTLLLTLALGTLLSAVVASAAPQKNVLFIASDDLRTDIGCYGDKEVKTPNLDRLAKRGLLFNRAYCQQAVCNPSRASILTGRRPDTLRIWDLATHFRSNAPDAVTLPQHFKNNGYFTQNIGKIFHNWIHKIQGDPDSWSVPAQLHFASHGNDKPQVEGKVPPNLAKDPKCECRDVPDEAYYDGRVAKLAVEALRERKAAGQPFFLGLGFWKPHAPFNAPKRYWDMYEREKLSMPRNPEWPDKAPRIAWHDSREILGSGKSARKITDDSIREMRHGYLANITYMDAQLGKVLDELDRLKLTDSTVIVFWSDHGYHLGEQTLWAKTSNFELDAHVPLIIATPGMKTAGQTTDSMAELLDLYPTLVDVCGLPKAASLDGVSLKPVLDSPTAKPRTLALTQHPRPAYYDREPSKTPTTMGYSVRTGRYRYTEWRDWNTGQTIAKELYDHQEDPYETRNVVADPNNRKPVSNCVKALNSFKPIVRPGWTPVLP